MVPAPTGRDPEPVAGDWIQDPYLLAFLCGGRRHLLRVALLSLIDRELLQAREFFRGLNSRGKSLRLHAPTHELELAVSLKILAAFQGFCARHRVVGHISLSGGDPLWYPGTRTL